MADHISFCINDVVSFRTGAEKARDEIWRLEREFDPRVKQALFEAERIMKHVEGEMNVMEDDRKTAVEVREHNIAALSRMESALAKLEEEKARLDEQLADANRKLEKAGAEKSRLDGLSLPSTGNSGADAKLAQIKAKSQEAAARGVQAAEQKLSQIRASQQLNSDSIGKLRADIDAVRRSIEELYQVIRELEDKLARASDYLRRLTDAKNQTQWKFSQYSAAVGRSTGELLRCIEDAQRAEQHGWEILQFLDLRGDFYSCRICFKDHEALTSFSGKLSNISRQCRQKENDLHDRVRDRTAELRDNVMAGAVTETNDICEVFRQITDELTEVARNCKMAGRELVAYYQLRPCSW